MEGRSEHLWDGDLHEPQSAHKLGHFILVLKSHTQGLQVQNPEQIFSPRCAQGAWLLQSLGCLSEIPGGPVRVEPIQLLTQKSGGSQVMKGGKEVLWLLCQDCKKNLVDGKCVIITLQGELEWATGLFRGCGRWAERG